MRNPTSLEGNLVAEAHLDEMMLGTVGLKEVTGTDTSLQGAATTTATTEGAEVATGTRGEDSAAEIHEAMDVMQSHLQESLTCT